MFYQIFQIIRFFIRKYREMESLKKLQTPQLKIYYETEKRKSTQQVPQQSANSLLKLKFAQIEKDKFFLRDAQKYLNQKQDDNYLLQLSKLMQGKQTVLNTNYSKTEGILKQTLNILTNHSRYTHNYIKISQEKIRKQKSLLENDPDDLQNLFKVARQEVVSKTKCNLNNIKQKLKRENEKKQKKQKDQFSEIGVQADKVPETSVQFNLKRQMQKKKIQQKFNKQQKQNNINKNKITQMQILVQKKQVQIMNLNSQIKKLQSTLLSVNYQYQKIKQQYNFIIQSTRKTPSIQLAHNKQIKKNSSIKQKITNKLRQSLLKSKKQYFDHCSNVYNYAYNIKSGIIKIDKYTDTRQLLSYHMQNIRQKIYNRPSQSQLIIIKQQNKTQDQQNIEFSENQYRYKDVQIQANFCDCNVTQKKVQVKFIKQIQSNNYIKSNQRGRSSIMLNQNPKFNLNSNDSSPPLKPIFESNFDTGITFTNTKNEQINIQTKANIIEPKQSIQEKKIVNKSLKRLSKPEILFRKSELKQKQKKQIIVIRIEQQNLGLFGTEQQARNYELVRINNLKNNNRRIKTELCDKVQKQQRIENKQEEQVQQIIQNLYKYMKNLKGKNIKKYTRLKNYLRFPYSFIKFQHCNIWQDSKNQQPQLTFYQLKSIFKKIIRFHNKCFIQKSSILCTHIITFFNKIHFTI